jgi:hypothetical protein
MKLNGRKKMKIKSLLLKAILASWLCVLISINLSFAEVPVGFKVVKSTNGVTLYQKDYYNGQPDYVHVIDLKLEASIKLLHGTIIGPGSEPGVFGGPNPIFKRQSLNQSWQKFSSDNETAFSITNGQFFNDQNRKSTSLSFALKVDGNIVSEGFEHRYQSQKLMLEIWNEYAYIGPFNESNFYSSSAPNIIGGLDESTNIGNYGLTGRTFVGIDDADNDGTYETILIFNSLISTQQDAAQVLRDFGADKVMMLDGGGSTQLICEGKNYIESYRTIPQMIGVLKSNVVNLLSVTIEGLPEIYENSCQIYRAIAKFSDGKSQNVSQSTVWKDNSRYATLKGMGQDYGLLANEVPMDKWIRITVTYSYGKIEKKAHKFVKIIDTTTLTSLKIIGPSSVEENSYATYRARAKLSDKSVLWVTANALWNMNSPYAHLNNNQLVTKDVSSDQTVKITASYSYNGVTKQAEKYVVITDITFPSPPPYAVFGGNPTTNGGGTWGAVFSMSGSITGNILTLTVTKIGGTPWETSGYIFFKLDDYDDDGIKLNGSNGQHINAGTPSVSFQIDLSQFSGSYPRSFYVFFNSDPGGFAWGGPITVIENSN